MLRVCPMKRTPPAIADLEDRGRDTSQAKPGKSRKTFSLESPEKNARLSTF